MTLPASDLAPGFLVAVPQLRDPNFHRSIVLMLEHGDPGALGLVVNRPASVSLEEVARSQGFETRPEMADHAVYIGGPVQPERGFILHDRDDIEESVPLFDGLHVSASLESLRTLVAGPLDRFRLLLGYSGWGPGQLERELQEGSWLTAKPDVRHVLESAHDKAWELVLRDMGIDPATLVMGGGLH